LRIGGDPKELWHLIVDTIRAQSALQLPSDSVKLLQQSEDPVIPLKVHSGFGSVAQKQHDGRCSLVPPMQFRDASLDPGNQKSVSKLWFDITNRFCDPAQIDLFCPRRAQKLSPQFVVC